jgi:hypothetical protein
VINLNFMMHISNFVEQRADGKSIPTGMDAQGMLDLGWAPSKVIALRWTLGARQIEFPAPHGVLGAVVPGRQFIVVMVRNDDSDQVRRLTVLNADGSVHGRLDNQLHVGDATVDGRFGWFEPAMTPAPNTFGAVFQTNAGDDLRCDIDAAALSVLRIARTR